MADSETVEAKLILHLGCGNTVMMGAVNHDLQLYAPHVDVAHDLNVYPWPWPDNHFAVVYAIDLIEHLDSFIGFFDECWRILQPDGKVVVRTPRFNSENTFIDPTHKRGYHPESFDYLDPSTKWGTLYGMYTARKWKKISIEDGFNIQAVLQVVKGD